MVFFPVGRENGSDGVAMGVSGFRRKWCWSFV